MLNHRSFLGFGGGRSFLGFGGGNCPSLGSAHVFFNVHNQAIIRLQFFYFTVQLNLLILVIVLIKTIFYFLFVSTILRIQLNN